MEGVQIIDRQWRYRYVNEAAAAHGQRSVDQLVGRSIVECYPGIEQTEMFGALQRVMQTRRPTSLRNAFAYPSGELRWFDLLVNAVPDGICVLSLDVTERRKAEEELHHARRLDAIGQLAGGVAHDFNNQLTVIRGLADLLLTGELDNSTRQDLQAIRDAADRSTALTRRLVTFSQRHAIKVEPINVNEVVARVDALLRRVLGADVTCELRLDPGLPLTMGDAQQLENVLTNLAVNARDAMPAGGCLVVETSVVDLTAEDARQHPSMQSGHYVTLSVADTGHGMDDATKSRIFEPFFTTKERGRGTGLGLAMVYGIVTQMGGFIWVYSEVGRGSTFRLYFPVTGEAARAREEPIPNDDQHKPVTVLVIEDDTGVRELVVRALTHHGHTVLAATNGDQAREHLRHLRAPPDVILADIVLPGENGPELIADLAMDFRRTVFMSGYAEKRLQHEGLDSVCVLEKPFTVGDLLRTVNATLLHTA